MMPSGLSVAKRVGMRTHILGLLVLGIAARAGADPLAVADPLSTEPGVATDVGEPQPPDRAALFDNALHFDFGAGAEVGHIAAGDMTGTGGLHMSLGLRRGRVSLIGELELAATQSDQDSSAFGVYERVALEARFALWQGVVRGSRTELWIEPGLGYETASQLNNMASIGRRDVSFSLGITKTHPFGSRTFGVYAALRVMDTAPIPGEPDHGLSVLLTSGLLLGH